MNDIEKAKKIKEDESKKTHSWAHCDICATSINYDLCYFVIDDKDIYSYFKCEL